MSKNALIVGINYYCKTPLYGCVNDAQKIYDTLRENGDRSMNFDCKLLTASTPNQVITNGILKGELKDLFSNQCDVALFYFSGHGFADENGGYICTSEVGSGDDGISMDQLANIVDRSKARNRIIILDCCHAGSLGNNVFFGNKSFIPENTTYLTACTDTQYSFEANGEGVFTGFLCDALNGQAANILGEISPGSVYAHIDKSLGSYGQRPVFKTNVQNFICLKKVKPHLQIAELKRMTEFFPIASSIFPLDPSFEPTEKSANSINTEKFALLQEMVKLNLVLPVKEKHMYYAALKSTGCALTFQGKHYWNLIKNNRI